VDELGAIVVVVVVVGAGPHRACPLQTFGPVPVQVAEPEQVLEPELLQVAVPEQMLLLVDVPEPVVQLDEPEQTLPPA